MVRSIFLNYFKMKILLLAKLKSICVIVIETIVGVLLKDGFLLTLEKLLRENNKYFKKNKQWMFLIMLANVTKKGTKNVVTRFKTKKYTHSVYSLIMF